MNTTVTFAPSERCKSIREIYGEPPRGERPVGGSFLERKRTEWSDIILKEKAECDTIDKIMLSGKGFTVVFCGGVRENARKRRRRKICQSYLS